MISFFTLIVPVGRPETPGLVSVSYKEHSQAKVGSGSCYKEATSQETGQVVPSSEFSRKPWLGWISYSSDFPLFVLCNYLPRIALKIVDS